MQTIPIIICSIRVCVLVGAWPWQIHGFVVTRDHGSVLGMAYRDIFARAQLSSELSARQFNRLQTLLLSALR